jgi:hypothetical protein
VRPSLQTLAGGAGVPITGAWVPLSYNALAFNAVAVGLAWGSGGTTLTWSAQITFDDFVFERLITASQTTTTITVTDPGGYATPTTLAAYYGPGGNLGHGLAIGDSVTLKGCGSGMDGTYAVATVPSNTSYTVTSLISQSATAAAGARVTPLRVMTHPGLNGITAGTTARVFANIGAGQPDNSATATAVSPSIITGIRPTITAWTSGNLDFLVLQGVGSR